MNRTTPAPALLIILALIALNTVMAANDPGHDSLYVLKVGDSNVSGSINLTGNLTATLVQATSRFFGPNIDIRGDGTSSTAPTRIIGGSTNLELTTATGGILLENNGGYVQIGTLSTPANLFVNGTIFQSGVAVCLSNGTNCPMMGGSSSAGGWSNTSTTTTTQLQTVINSSNGAGSFIVLNTTGSAQLFVNGTNGYVGIGTIIPSQRFDVNGSINVSGTGASISVGTRTVCLSDGSNCPAISGTSNAAGWTNTSWAVSLVNVSNNVSANNLFVDNTNGRVGIGTTAPAATLTVNSSSNTGSFLVQNTTGTPHLFVNGSTGNVGIGTVTPTQMLSVISPTSSAGATILISGQAAGSGTSAGINLRNPATGGNNWALWSTDGNSAQVGAFVIGKAGGYPTFVIDTNNNVGIGNYMMDASLTGATMVVKAAGNVGIGTTNPSGTLAINNSGSADYLDIMNGTKSILHYDKAYNWYGGDGTSNYSAYNSYNFMWGHGNSMSLTNNALGNMGGNAIFGNGNTISAFYAMNTNFIAGSGNTISDSYASCCGGANAVILGNNNQARGGYTIGINNQNYAGGISIGSYAQTTANAGGSVGLMSFAIGNNIQSNAIDNMIIGVAPQWAINSIPYSVMLVANSTTPAITMLPGNGGSAIGNVGIGTTSPGQLLTIAGSLTNSSPKAGYLSTDNLLLSSLDGGMYFGRTGVKEEQWGLNNYGNTWTQKGSSHTWWSVAMSSDGKIQTAVDTAPGYLYISTDYGNTWTQTGSSHGWTGVAMSSDGKIQTAVDGNPGFIYVSTDYGNNWTAKGSSYSWNAVAMSSDGRLQTAVVNGGYIYLSTDFGNTWVQTGSSFNWKRLAMSSDGKVQTAAGYNTNIYVSTDYGNTWSAKGSSFSWMALAMSSDGKYQTAGVNLGYLYTSSDYGNTWVQKGNSLDYQALAMSGDGKIQTAGANSGYLWVSTDYGNTWAYKGSSLHWRSVAMSSDGKIQTAVDSLGGLYVSYADSYTSGNVGIGTTSPGARLDVNSGASGLQLSSSAVNFYGAEAFLEVNGNTFLRTSGGDTSIQTAGTERIRILTSNGNVGIGTASPDTVFDVVTSGGNGLTNTVHLVNSGGYGAGLTLESKDTGGKAWQIRSLGTGGAAPAGSLIITEGVGGTDRLAIMSGGNVGIGTTAPGAKLEIKDGYFRVADGANNAPTTGKGLEIVTTGNVVYAKAYNRDTSAVMDWHNGKSDEQFVLLGSGASYFNQGNVGIGTTSPPTALSVVGTINATAGLTVGSVSAPGGLALLGANNWYINSCSGGCGAGSGAFQISVNGQYPSFVINPSYDFGIGGSITNANLNGANLVIKNGGSVGINTTSPTSTLHVIGTGNFSSNLYAGSCVGGSKLCTDIAELYPSVKGVQAGDVVCVGSDGNATLCGGSFAHNVLGIISSYPAIVIEGGQVVMGRGNYTNTTKQPIALKGRVPVKVTCDDPITIGDPLVSDSKPGYARKLNLTTADWRQASGTTIGKAIEPCSSGEATILAWVG